MEYVVGTDGVAPPSLPLWCLSWVGCYEGDGRAILQFLQDSLSGGDLDTLGSPDSDVL